MTRKKSEKYFGNSKNSVTFAFGNRTMIILSMFNN